MEIDVVLVIIGIIVWPELTLAVILWNLGHPALGVFALLFASTTSVKTIIREKIINSSGQVISSSEREET
jgi:hypothetical protein